MVVPTSQISENTLSPYSVSKWQNDPPDYIILLGCFKSVLKGKIAIPNNKALFPKGNGPLKVE